MRFDVVTLFPEMFEPFARLGVVGRALEEGRAGLRLRSPRAFGHGKHRSVDDTPYGGGAGMVMRVDCLVACLEDLDADAPGGELGQRVLLTPQGRPLTQAVAAELTTHAAVTLVCGRYEGFDARIREFVGQELSLGDFVLSGGELAAMAVIDACVRLLPGVLGNAGSLQEESHAACTGGLLEYPHYTRPATFRGREVPVVLRSGDHAKIGAWRREQALQRTAAMRPDIAAGHPAPGARGGDR